MMDGRALSGSNPGRGRVAQVALWALLGIAPLGITGGPVSASPIRSESIVVTNIDSLGPVWERFLSLGPTFWADHAAPRFKSDLILPKTDGVLVETPFVEYLDWRRGLDPTRFDHYHPIVGPELGQLSSAQTITSLTTGALAATSVGGGSPVPLLTHVPEPASLLTALTLLGAATIWGCHARLAVARNAQGGSE